MGHVLGQEPSRSANPLWPTVGQK